MANPKTFMCPGCAKRYTWRPQLAGKQAKCVCGRMINVPQPQDDAPADHESGLYDIVPDESPTAASVQPTVARCPNCHSILPAASALCIHCGFDAVVGKKLVPPAQTTGVAMAEHQRVTAAANKTKILLLAGLLVFVIAGAVIGGMVWKKYSASPSTALTASLAEDQAIEQMMKEEGATEIREWLKGNPRHQVQGMSETQAQARADEWYKLGAKRVIAFGEVMTASLAIELPDDAAKRKAFFAAAPKWMRPNEKAPSDVGQKWMLIKMTF